MPYSVTIHRSLHNSYNTEDALCLEILRHDTAEEAMAKEGRDSVAVNSMLLDLLIDRKLV